MSKTSEFFCSSYSFSYVNVVEFAKFMFLFCFQDEEVLPKSLEYFSYLIHLAVFGILGVIHLHLFLSLKVASLDRIYADVS